MAGAVTQSDDLNDLPLDELSLDELAIRLAPAVADAATFDGWTDEAVAMAADMEGVDPDIARLAYKGGAMAMIGAWITSTDRAMAEALPPQALVQMKIRERIRALVQFRLDAVAGRDEALRRALAIQAMPHNAPAALKIAWNSADVMWRLAGDTATDYNHYTKRAILASIYGATLLASLDDQTEDKRETAAFLDRRIDAVMRFEKAKAQLLGSGRERFSVARFLGRLRYPAR